LQSKNLSFVAIGGIAISRTVILDWLLSAQLNLSSQLVGQM